MMARTGFGGGVPLGTGVGRTGFSRKKVNFAASGSRGHYHQRLIDGLPNSLPGGFLDLGQGLRPFRGEVEGLSDYALVGHAFHMGLGAVRIALVGPGAGHGLN